MLTRAQELRGKAEQFAARAAHAKQRRERNTCLSLEQSYRSLAAHQERFEAAARERDDEPEAAPPQALRA